MPRAFQTRSPGQGSRPKDPHWFGVDLCQEQIPDGFIKADIREHGKHNILLATDDQLLLEQLSKAKSWYIDGIFKLVKHPAITYNQSICANWPLLKESAFGLCVDVFKEKLTRLS